MRRGDAIDSLARSRRRTRDRRWERVATLREREETGRARALLGVKTPFYAGAAALIVVVAVVFAVGGSQPVDPEARGRLFAAPPRRDGEGRSPLSSLRRTIQEGFDEFTPASEDPSEPTDEPDDDAPATDEPVETEPAAVPTEEPAATDVPAATAEPSAAPASGTPAGSPAPEATSAPVG